MFVSNQFLHPQSSPTGVNLRNLLTKLVYHAKPIGQKIYTHPLNAKRSDAKSEPHTGNTKTRLECRVRTHYILNSKFYILANRTRQVIYRQQYSGNKCTNSHTQYNHNNRLKQSSKNGYFIIYFFFVKTRKLTQYFI